MVHPLSDPMLRLFSICAAILTINMLFKATLIGVLRNVRGVHISPEDCRFWEGQSVRPTS